MDDDSECLLRLRLNPYEEEHPCRALHDSCFRSHQRLAWTHAHPFAKDAMRGGFVFALSIVQSPSREGSTRALLDKAFPPGSLPSSEGNLHGLLEKACSALGHARFRLDEHAGARATELAPLFFGGLEWLMNPELCRLSRLAFCQTLADACASRLFFDGRAWERPRPEALALFEEALLEARALPWPNPQPFDRFSHEPLCAGPADQWIATRAARERIAMDERSLLTLSCALADDGRETKRL